MITSSFRRVRSVLGRPLAWYIISDAMCLEIHARKSELGWLFDGTLRLDSLEPIAPVSSELTRHLNGCERFLVEYACARRSIASASSVDRDLL